MADKVLPGPVDSGSCPAAGVNIHTGKILDACRDKDCIDDLRVYPTVSSQAILDSAFSVRPQSAELLHAEVNVDAISFNRGYYTVDVTFFYGITGETFPGGIPVRGLAVFDKRVILYGSEGGVKTFSSLDALTGGVFSGRSEPVAVVEAVDPIALNLRICEAGGSIEPERRAIPRTIIETVGEEISLAENGKKLFVTLGQFSIIRLERDYQISVYAESYLPQKECVGSSDDDPCTLFSRVGFPVEEFYPPDTMPCGENYRDLV